MAASRDAKLGLLAVAIAYLVRRAIRKPPEEDELTALHPIDARRRRPPTALHPAMTWSPQKGRRRGEKRRKRMGPVWSPPAIHLESRVRAYPGVGRTPRRGCHERTRRGLLRAASGPVVAPARRLLPTHQTVAPRRRVCACTHAFWQGSVLPRVRASTHPTGRMVWSVGYASAYRRSTNGAYRAICHLWFSAQTVSQSANNAKHRLEPRRWQSAVSFQQSALRRHSPPQETKADS